MIDLNHERLITLSQAVNLIPRRRGQKVRNSTIWRWIVSGKKGIRLEGMKTPAGWCTTAEAMGRFLSALADKSRGELLGPMANDAMEPEGSELPAPQPILGPGSETPEHQAAVEELRRAGVIE